MSCSVDAVIDNCHICRSCIYLLCYCELFVSYNDTSVADLIR